MSSENPSLRPIPIEEVARFPRPGFALPQGYSFRPDGKVLTYLASPEGGLSQRLYQLDVETGESSVLATAPGSADEDDIPLEEKLRRERMRQRAVGITRYAWSQDGERVLIPLLGALYVLDAPGEPLRELVSASDGVCIDPRWSPDSSQVAFVRDAELYVVAAEGGVPRQITSGARGTGRTHGLAEFVAQEEMGRLRGFWWAPDSNSIAFQEVDETHIAEYRIVHQGKDAVGAGAQEDHRYPFAGDPNARVRLGIVSVDGGEPVWLDLGEDEDIYLARARWFPDGRPVAQLLNREQSELRLLQFDPATGAATELLREQSDVWINIHNCLRPLEHGEEMLHGGFLWASERTGFRHLELRARDGSLVRVLTEGEWMVDAVAAVDETARVVYFTGTRDGATESRLYSVSYDGGDPVGLSSEPGMHAVTMSPDASLVMDRYHAVDRPPCGRLHRVADGQVIATLFDGADDARVAELGLEPPELVQITSRDGAALDAAIYRPPVGEGPWPVVVSVYGGPHAQRVKNGYDMTVDMRAQALRRMGYLVFVLDNRGATRRGLAFEGAIRHDMGNLEVDDQVDGVRWLAEQGLGDPERVAIYGWSYGGYMSLMCLARAPDVFRAAVSGAPVTSWDGYDTCYTERYMGTPQSNPEGYERSSVMSHVEGMRGKLMLVHGMLDENVHFRHTARLINALIRARKEYQLLLFPDERHMPRGEADRVYMEEHILAFLEDALRS